MNFLLWDIDGTLLTTGRAGIYAWEDAALDVLGIELDFGSLETAGFTDIEIGALILRMHDHPSDPGDVARIVGLYEDYLPRSLPRKQGRVLPNVTEVLTSLGETANVHSTLLTGNTRRGAAAKLGHYGLDGFFDFDLGAFSDGLPDRPSVARRATSLLQAAGHEFDPSRVLVIGDTPHDIHCANAIGARTLAVATGGYTREALEAHSPWLVLDQLPAPDRFHALLEDGA